MPLTPEEQERLAQLEAEIGHKVSPTSQGDGVMDWLSGATDAFTDDLMAGFGKRLTAAESATLGRQPGGGTLDFSVDDILMPWQEGWDERYDQALDAEKQQQALWAYRNPKSNLAARLGGAITSAALTRNPATLGKQLGSMAGWGAAYGAGHSEGDMFSAEQARDAAEGAAFGLMAGTALKGVGKGVKRIGESRALRKALDSARPSIEKMSEKVDDLYDSVRTSGVTLTEASRMGFAERVVSSVLSPKLSLNRGENARVVQWLDNHLKALGANPNLYQIEQMRRAASRELFDGINDRFGLTIKKTIDDFLDELQPTQVQYSSRGNVTPMMQSILSRAHPDAVSAARYVPKRTMEPVNAPGLTYNTKSKEQIQKVLRDLKEARNTHQVKVKLNLLRNAFAKIREDAMAGKRLSGRELEDRLTRLLTDPKYINPRTGENMRFTPKEIKEFRKIIEGDALGKWIQRFSMLSPATAYGQLAQILFHSRLHPQATAAGAAIGGSAMLAKRLNSQRVLEQMNQLEQLIGTGRMMPRPNLPNKLGSTGPNLAGGLMRLAGSAGGL